MNRPPAFHEEKLPPLLFGGFLLLSLYGLLLLFDGLLLLLLYGLLLLFDGLLLFLYSLLLTLRRCLLLFGSFSLLLSHSSSSV